MGKQREGQSQPISAEEIQKQLQGAPSETSNSKGLVSAADIQKQVQDQKGLGFQTTDLNVDIEAYSKYINDIKPLEDIDLQRAMNQGFWEQAGSSLIQAAGEVVGGTIEGLGSIPELFVSVNDEITSQAADFDNAIIAFGRSIREGAQDIAPIYRTDPNASFDVLDSGWWFSNIPSVFSSLSMLVPAKAATSGLSLLSKMGKAGQLGKLGKAASGMNAGVKYATKLGLGAAVSRNAENFRESYQVYDEAYKSTLEALKDDERRGDIENSETYAEARNYYGKDQISDDELAQFIGSRASWRSYQVNSANIVFDALQFAPLLRGAKVSTRTGFFGKNAKLLEANGKKLTRLQKVMYKANPIVSPIAASLSEGVEEGINFVGTEEGNHYAASMLGTADEDSTFTARVAEYMQDGHMWEGAAWGVMGGALYSGVGSMRYKDVGPQSQAAKLAEIKSRQQYITQMATAIQFYETNPELDEKTKALKIKQLKANAAYMLGRNAAKAGNVDLLLEQLEDPAFQKQFVKNGWTTEEDLSQTTSELKRHILRGEELYKKHAGKFFYSDVSQGAKDVLERAYSSLENEKQLNAETLSEVEKEVRNMENGLGLTPEQTAQLDALTLSEAIAVLDNLANEAKVDGNTEQAKAYEEMSANVEAQLENVEAAVPSSTPDNISDELLSKRIQRTIYKTHEGLLNKRQKELANAENQKEIDEKLKKAQAESAKKTEENQLKVINESEEASDMLYQLAKSPNQKVANRAKERLQELGASVKRGRVRNAVGKAVRNAQEAVGAKPKNTNPEASEKAPSKEPGRNDKPKSTNPEGADFFVAENKEPVRPEDEAPLVEPTYETTPEAVLDANAEDAADMPDTTSLPEDQENDPNRAVVMPNGKVLRRNPAETKSPEEVQEDPESEADLLEMPEDVEMDMYTLGININGFFDVQKNVPLLDQKGNPILDADGNEVTGNRALNSVVNLEGSDMGKALDALYNLQPGDKLTLIYKDGKASFQTADGVEVSTLQSLEIARKRVANAKRKGDKKYEARENIRLAKLERIYEFLEKAQRPVTITVKEKSGGSIMNTLEPSPLGEGLRNSIQELGLFYAASNTRLESSTGDIHVYQGNDVDSGYTPGAFYAMVPNMSGENVPVRLGTTRLTEVDGAATAVTRALNELIQVIKNNPTAQRNETVIQNAVAKVGQFVTVNNPIHGIRVYTKGGFSSIMIPGPAGSYKATEILIARDGKPYANPVVKEVTLDADAFKAGNVKIITNSSTRLNISAAEAIRNSLGEMLLDIDKTLVNDQVRASQPFVVGDKTYPSYLEFLMSNLKSNVGSIKTSEGVRHFSPVSTGTSNSYGVSIKVEFTSLQDQQAVTPKLKPAKKVSAVKKPNKTKGYEKAEGKATKLTDNSYNKFVDSGKVGIAVRRGIAKKIAEGQNLTAKEESVRQAYAQEIEGMLQYFAEQSGTTSTESDAGNQTRGWMPPLDGGSALFLRTDGTKVPYSKPENLDAAEEWFKSVFPHVPFVRVKGLIENGGELAYGMFADASVVLSDLAVQGTVYHEAFHTAMHLYLTEEQRQQIYAEARNEFPDMSDAQLEEELAEKFRAHMILNGQETNPKTAIGRWFKKLVDLVKMFISKPNHTERLFRDIKSGSFNYKPTPQMMAHAKRFSANKAVEGLTSMEQRQVVNTLSSLMSMSVEYVRKNYSKLKEMAPEGVDTSIPAMVKNQMLATLEAKRDDAQQRFNSDNIRRVLQQFEDGDFGDGIFTKSVEAFRVRFGIDLNTISTTKFEVKSNTELGTDEDVDLTNEEFEGLNRTWGDSLIFHNGKDSISRKVKNTIMTTFKLSSWNKVDYVKNGLTTIQDDDVNTNTFLGTAEFVDFDAIYPYMESHLAGISSTQQMMDRIADFAESADPSFGGIYLKLLSDKDLQSAFYTHFSKQRPTVLLPTIGSEISNQFELFQVNRNNSELLIREKFLAQAAEAKPVENAAEIMKGLTPNLSNEQFAMQASQAMARMGMSLVENGTDVMQKAFARELNKGNFTKGQLLKSIDRLANSFVRGQITNEVGNLTRLGKMIRLYKMDAIQNVMQNVEGKNIYGVTHSTFMSNFMELVQDPTRTIELQMVLTDMLKDPRMKRSNYMRLLVEFDGTNPVYEENSSLVKLNPNRDKLGYALLDGLKNDDANQGVKYSGMVSSEYDVLAAGMFLRGLTGGDGIIASPTVIPSDKSTMYLITAPRFGTNGLSDYRTSLGRALVGELKAIEREAARVFVDPSKDKLQVNENADLQQYYNADKKGNVVSVDSTGKQTIHGSGFKLTLTEHEGMRAAVPEAFHANGLPTGEYTPEMLKKMVDYIIRTEIMPEAAKINETVAKNEELAPMIKKYGPSFANDFAIHNFLHNYEYGLFFHAPTSEFKNKVESSKRGASATTPGISLNIDVLGPTFNAITLTDVVRPSENYSQMVEAYVRNAKAALPTGTKVTKETEADLRKEAESVLAPYKNIETTDAQGYITLDRYEKIVRARGMWNSDWDTMFKKARAGQDLTMDEARVFLMPIKPLYYGRKFDSKLGRMRSDLVKLSSMPLVPAMTKGTELDKLRKFMEENKVDEAFYNTAHKVGATNVATAHDKDFKFTDAQLTPKNIRTLDNRNYQIQLDTPEHLVDTTNKVGSQLAKLILANLNPAGSYGKFNSMKDLVDTYQSATEGLLKLAHGRLLNEIGAVKGPDGKFRANPKKLEQVVQRQLADRNAPSMLRDALKLDENGNFIIPPFFSGFANKFESILLSMFTNNVTNLKVPGGTAIQASSAFYAPDGVRPTVVFKEDGGIDHYQVFLPAYMKEQFTDMDGNIKSIEDIPGEALEMIGYRIPTEGKSSMAPLKVAGFLPNSMGSTIIVPDEFVVQMGSDFDVDKLFLQMRNVGKDISKEQKMQNDIFDVFQSVLQSPDHMQEVVTPQGFADLKNIALDIAGAGDDINPLLYTSQAEFRKRNRTGSNLIGIAANINVFASVAQLTEMRLADDIAFRVRYSASAAQKAIETYGKENVIKNEDGSVTVIHNRIGHTATGAMTSIDGSMITSNLAQFVGGTVDNAKDPIFDKFNGNEYTLPTVMAMVATGVPLDIALRFSAQPALQKIAEKNLAGKGIFGTAFSNEFETVKTEYYTELNKVTGKYISPKTTVNQVMEMFKVPAFELGLGSLRKELNRSKDFEALSTDEKVLHLVNQLQLIDQFRQARKAGQAVQDGYRVFKTDVQGAGPSTSATHSVLKTIERSLDYNGEGPRLMIGDKSAVEAIYPREINPQSKEKSAYPILEAYLNLSNKRSVEILSEVFFTETPEGQAVINKILNEVADGRWDDNVVRKAKNMINQYLLNKTLKFHMGDGSVLMRGSEGIASSNDVTKENFNRASVAQQLAYVQRQYPELANDPLHILNRLRPELSKEKIESNQGLHLIHFDNISDAAIDEMLADSFNDMFFSEDPILTELAANLVLFNFKNKGMAFQRGSFSKILSPEVLNAFDIGVELTKALNMGKGNQKMFGDNPADLYASINYRDFSGFPVAAGKRAVDENGFVTIAKPNNPKTYVYDRRAKKLYKLANVQEETVTYRPMQMYGIPGKLVEFGNSIVHPKVTSGSYQSFSKIDAGNLDTQETIDDKVSRLRENFTSALGVQVEVKVDPNMKENAKVETVNGSPVITLSDTVFGDTVIHEFGHIYVDLLGVDNALVKQGIEQLRGTELWNQVEKAYPELSGDALAKEVLVTAIGREGEKLYNNERSQKRWRIWMNKFFRAVGRVLGVQPNAARELARQMLEGDMQRGAGTLSDYTQYQKKPDTLEDFIEDTKVRMEKMIEKYGDKAKGLENLLDSFSETDQADTLGKVSSHISSTVAGVRQYINEQTKFLSDPANMTKRNIDNMFTTLFNARQALYAFNDVGYLGKDMASDKATKKILKKLNKQKGDIEATIGEIDKISRNYLNIVLKQNSSNPKVAQEVFDLFKGEGVEFADENWGQLRLDALADTNLSFVALAIKDYNIEKALNERRTSDKLADWQDLIERMENDGVDIQSFLDKDADGEYNGKYLPIAKAQQVLSPKAFEYYNEVRRFNGSLVAHTDRTIIKYGYIPAVPSNEVNYWERVKSLTKKKAKDGEAVEQDEDLQVTVDETGSVVNILPFRYLRKLDQLRLETPKGNETPAELAEMEKRNEEIQAQNRKRHAAALNYDLKNTMEQFIYTAMEHKFKSSMEGRMLLIREQLKSMDIITDTRLVDKVKQRVTGKKESPTIKGEESNVYKHYEMWLKMVFYDQFEADENKTFKAIAKHTQNWMSMTRIGFNVFSGINNKVYGELMTSIEAAAGQFFNAKDWAQAKKDYYANTVHYMGKRGVKKSENFFEGAIKYFDILQNQDELQGKAFAKGSAMHKLAFAKNSLYALQHMGEHSMQNQVLFAMMNSEKVMLNGKEVSLKDALELKDGFIKIKEGATRKDGKPLTEKDLARFKTKVIGVNQYLHGIYNKEDAGTIQHYAMGRMAMQFRKWARPGWNKRFGTKFGKSFWNERRDMLDEGMYVTAFNFGLELMKDLKNFEANYKAAWDKLDDTQKANVRRTLMEMTYFISAAILSGIALSAAADDDDNRSLAVLGQMSDRIYSELSTYTPWGVITEGKRLITSPFAGMSGYETVSKMFFHTLSGHAFDPEKAYYRGGMYYGERKLSIWLKSLIPVLGQAQRWNFIEDQVRYYNLYGL